MAGNKMTTRQRYEPGYAVFSGPEVTYRIPYSGPVPMDYSAAVAAFDVRMNRLEAAVAELVAAKDQPMMQGVYLVEGADRVEMIGLLKAALAARDGGTP